MNREIAAALSADYAALTEEVQVRSSKVLSAEFESPTVSRCPAISS